MLVYRTKWGGVSVVTGRRANGHFPVTPGRSIPVILRKSGRVPAGLCFAPTDPAFSAAPAPAVRCFVPMAAPNIFPSGQTASLRLVFRFRAGAAADPDRRLAFWVSVLSSLVNRLPKLKVLSGNFGQ